MAPDQPFYVDHVNARVRARERGKLDYVNNFVFINASPVGASAPLAQSKK